MTPQAFRNYWDINHQQLGEALGVNPQSVRRWFSDPKSTSYRRPSLAVQLKLDQIHKEWLDEQTRQQRLRQLQAWKRESNYRTYV